MTGSWTRSDCPTTGGGNGISTGDGASELTYLPLDPSVHIHRLDADQESACAKACPTDSVRYGPLDELRDRADQHVDHLHDAGVAEARLYRADPDDGVGGAGAFFLLLDEPEAYGFPPDPGGDHPRPSDDVAARRAGGNRRGSHLLAAFAAARR